LAALPVTNNLTISRGASAVSISGTNATFDGTAKGVTVTTVPAGLAVRVIYNGSTNSPTNSGRYTVVATVTDVNYTSSGSSAVLTIVPSSNTIAQFTTIPTQTYSSNATVAITPPSASSGLPVSLSVLSGPATLGGNTLTLTGTGTVVLAANQVGNSNYLPATHVTTSFTVSAAVAPVKVPVIYMEGSTVIRKKE
jgi:hypothetical protein